MPLKMYFFEYLVEVLCVLTLTLQSDYINHSRILSLKKNSVPFPPLLFSWNTNRFFDVLIFHSAAAINRKIEIGQNPNWNRKPSALGGFCTQPEVLKYCIYSMETIPCTKAIPEYCLDNTEASLTFLRGVTGADNSRTVTSFLLAVLCFSSQELKYICNILGELTLHTFHCCKYD